MFHDFIPTHDDYFRAKALAAIKSDRDRGLPDGDYSIATLMAIRDMTSNVVSMDDRFTETDKTVWELFYYYL